jgi:hypothetical protein
MVTAQPQILMKSVLWYEEIFVKTSLKYHKGATSRIMSKNTLRSQLFEKPNFKMGMTQPLMVTKSLFVVQCQIYEKMSTALFNFI